MRRRAAPVRRRPVWVKRSWTSGGGVAYLYTRARRGELPVCARIFWDRRKVPRRLVIPIVQPGASEAFADSLLNRPKA